MKRGEGWERELVAQHEIYRREQRATILRVHPEVRVTAVRGGYVTGRFAATGPPDFVGVLHDGQAVAADAKSSAHGYLLMTAIPRHQALDLTAWADRGGVALILARLGDAGSWVIDWRIVGAVWWARLHAWQPGDMGGTPMQGADWLSALGR